MRILFLALLFPIVIVSSAQQPENVKLVTYAPDLAISKGAWKGTLTYLDYTSGKPFTMPADVELNTDRRQMVILDYRYPQEPKANGKDTLKFSDNGLLIDGARIVSKTANPDGGFIIITEKDGVDGNQNKKAVIRHIYTFGKSKLQFGKEVKFEGTDEWIKRNEYLFGR